MGPGRLGELATVATGAATDHFVHPGLDRGNRLELFPLDRRVGADEHQVAALAWRRLGEAGWRLVVVERANFDGPDLCGRVLARPLQRLVQVDLLADGLVEPRLEGGLGCFVPRLVPPARRRPRGPACTALSVPPQWPARVAAALASFLVRWTLRRAFRAPSTRHSYASRCCGRRPRLQPAHPCAGPQPFARRRSGHARAGRGNTRGAGPYRSFPRSLGGRFRLVIRHDGELGNGQVLRDFCRPCRKRETCPWGLSRSSR